MSRTRCEKNISYDDQRKLYYLYMDLGRDKHGHRVRKYDTFSTLSAARSARSEFFAQKALDAVCHASCMTLEQWLREWMETVVIPNRAETTAYSYQKIIDNHLLPALGHFPLHQLTPRDLQQYYAKLMQRDGLSPNTVRRHHDLLSAALHAAVRQDLLLHSPTERVEPPRQVYKESNYYTAHDLKKLYKAIEGHWLETPVHLAGSLGLRREEICGLRWENVDFQQRKIYICCARTAAGGKIIEKDTKNRSSTRVLYMGDDIFQLLSKEKQMQDARKAAMQTQWSDTGLVAVDCMGVPLSPNKLSAAFTDFIRANELPPLTLHGLRHTFATVASAQGAPLFDIGKALGHSTPATTGKIYTHLADRHHAETLAKVAAALK